MLDVHLVRTQGTFCVDTAFTADATGITALFGRSGAGKTSIINMITGLARPDKGHIIVNGRCVFDSGKCIDIPTEKRRFGYVFQDARLFPHLSVRANLCYGMKRTPAAEQYITLEQVVDLLGIGPVLDRHPATLSGGEKQRVAIGRALLTSPELLLMDEPLASLDQARKNEVLPFISRLSRDISIPILYVSHSVDEVLGLADTLVLLSQGRPVATGPVGRIMGCREFQQITGQREAGLILTALIDSHNTGLGVTRLRFAGGILTVPLQTGQPGTVLSVHIRPSEVGISLNNLAGTSFQNVFPGQVTGIRVLPETGNYDVTITMGCDLVARVTDQILHDLDLKPGKTVHAVILNPSIS